MIENVTCFVDSIEELAKTTSGLIYRCSERIIKAKKKFTLVLSGGNTPFYVFSELFLDYGYKDTSNNFY